MSKKNQKKKKAKTIKIGKLEVGVIIELVILLVLIIGYIFSPTVYSVTTGLYNQSTKEDQENVVNALGEENTEERFEIYFQWYNVLHELGHGLLYYNEGVDLHIVDEEQLVNDFAVAYWKHYGEADKVKELENIVNYAVEHVGDNYKNNVDYIEHAKENSSEKSFNSSFFNFNDYGWFQFSSVKNSFETNKDLDTVLKEMGFKNYKLPEPQELKYKEINKETSTKVINDAVNNIRDWGLEFPNATHHYDKNPNNNYSKSMKKYLGLFEVPDFVYIFTF